MHGNVFEWCRDAFAEYTSPVQAGDGARQPQDPKRRMARGGSFLTPASAARVSARQGGLLDSKNFHLGVRPARAIARP
jgi:formylglycine-generating enzyme required for sulfatase activity